MDAKQLTTERGSIYGPFSHNARVTHAIYDVLLSGYNAGKLKNYHKEALHMIAHKMSRLVNGDPDHIDSWDDIGGYAQCAVDAIVVAKQLAPVPPKGNPSMPIPSISEGPKDDQGEYIP